VSYKRQALLILCVHLGSPMVFGGVSVAHLELFSSLCCVFVLFVFVLCLVCPMLPVSLDCPFLIAPSIFSNVYLFVCLFVFVLCLVYPMLPVSVDYPFLIALSVFSNVYLSTNKQKRY
jgi:hypothetical protein